MVRISTLLSVSVFAAVALARRPDIYAALQCISLIFNLEIITPTTPGYSDASEPFNLRIHTDPSIIVVP